MIKANHGAEQFQALSDGEKESLMESHSEEHHSSKGFRSLLSQGNSRITISLCVSWLCINFIYFGQLIVLPFIFGKQDKSFGDYLVTVLAELPTFLVSYNIIDRPHFGRKNSLTYFFVCSLAMHLFFAATFETLFASICRFFMKLCFHVIYPLTTECYPTSNRTLGFGTCSAVGRIGSTLMPLIILPLVEHSQHWIFVIFAFVAGLGASSSYMIPYDPMNYCLDERPMEMELQGLSSANN